MQQLTLNFGVPFARSHSLPLHTLGDPDEPADIGFDSLKWADQHIHKVRYGINTRLD